MDFEVSVALDWIRDNNEMESDLDDVPASARRRLMRLNPDIGLEGSKV